MIGEHPDVSTEKVAAVVSRAWGVDASVVRHAETESGSWHWSVGDEGGPVWFVCMDQVWTVEQHDARVASYRCAAQLSQRLDYVVAPVQTRDGRVAVDLAPGLLLTLTPFLDGQAFGTGPFVDDAQRADVSAMLGDLHRQPRQRDVPLWRPRIGQQSVARREDLERVLGQSRWTGGPWSVPTGRLLVEGQDVLRTAIRRFALLAAAVMGSMERWGLTHGGVRGENVIRTPDGPRLVDWGALLVAPRERDVCGVLGLAEGDDPWYAYLAAGGRPDPLSSDTCELFALEQVLSEVAEPAVLFASTHNDSADERRRFGDLEQALERLHEGWGPAPTT